MKNKYHHHKRRKLNTYVKPLTIYIPQAFIDGLKSVARNNGEQLEVIAATSLNNAVYKKYEVDLNAKEFHDKFYQAACNLILATLQHGLNVQDYFMSMMSIGCFTTEASAIYNQLLAEHKIKIEVRPDGKFMIYQYYAKPKEKDENYKGKNVNKKPSTKRKSLLSKGKR